MGNLNRVVYLTQEDYDTLRAEGSVTKNGKTITFNQNDLYVTSSTSVLPLTNNEAGWNLSTYYPKLGEIIIYEPDVNYTLPRIKIGDGIHLVKDLPFSLKNTDYYGNCSTAAATAEKTTTISNFELEIGVFVKIKFTYANTASSPTLSINSGTAKPIYISNGNISPWDEGEIVEMRYNGTQWQIIGDDKVEVVML